MMSRKNSLVLLLSLLFTSLIAQTTVHPIDGNILYKGIRNWISVGLPGIAADSIVVTAHHSEVEKISNWSWYITPDTGWYRERLIVTAFNQNKIVSIDTIEFRLKWIPDPKIYAGNIAGVNDSATIGILKATYGVSARLENFPYDVHCYVTSYDFRIEPYAPAYHGDSGLFTNEMRAAMANAKKGDRAVFYNIIVKYPDGRVKPANDVVITIK